jgi:hypothetical protein
MLNSSCGFCAYLLGYYTKYFKGSFYVNYALIGIADGTTMVYAKLISRFYPKMTNVIGFGLL